MEKVKEITKRNNKKGSTDFCWMEFIEDQKYSSKEE